MAFYEKYVSLCNSVKKSPSGVALEIGLSKTAVNGWKHGRSNPTDATKQKLADYFGCTISELTGEVDQNKKPAQESGPNKDMLLAWIETASREELIETLQIVTNKLSEK